MCLVLGHETRKGIRRGEEETLRELGDREIENM